MRCQKPPLDCIVLLKWILSSVSDIVDLISNVWKCQKIDNYWQRVEGNVLLLLHVCYSYTVYTKEIWCTIISQGSDISMRKCWSHMMGSNLHPWTPQHTHYWLNYNGWNTILLAHLVQSVVCMPEEFGNSGLIPSLNFNILSNKSYLYIYKNLLSIQTISLQRKLYYLW